MMQNFQFFSARSIEEGLDYLSEQEGSCKIIAGGTDLIPGLRNEDFHPDYVLNVMEIEKLSGITETDEAVRIGATTTFAEITKSDILNLCLPLLVQAASSVGGPQIRNRGTIGGNIVSSSPAADLLPAVLALDGQLELRSKRSGTRLLPLAEAIETADRSRLRSDEILTAIIIRKLPTRTVSGFEKLARRNAMARARMNISVVLSMDGGGIISELRIVPGAVMPVARRMREAEKTLLGKKPKKSLVEAAAEVITEEIVKVTGIRPSTEYKMPVLKNIFKRLLKQLLGES